MSVEQVKEDLAYLTANIATPMEQRVLLRASLEVALINLGHDRKEIAQALDAYYQRTLH